MIEWITKHSSSRTECVLSRVFGQSASLPLNKAHFCGLRPDFYYCQTVTGLLMLDALSDERTCLIAAGPRQRSHSRVRVPWYSWSYFTVSDYRLLFCRLLWIAGLRWRYSTPPPHGIECVFIWKAGARGSVVGWGTMLQAGRSRDRIPMRWIFSIYLIFQPHYGPGVDSASNRNENQEYFWG
jgi:hypothetical protein